MEAILHALVVHSLMQRFDDRRYQGQGHVPDAHPVQVHVRMFRQVGFGLLGNMIEEIGFLQIGVAEVWRQHGITPEFNS